MSLQLVEVVEPPSKSVSWIYISSLTLVLSGALFYIYLARVLPYTDLGAVVILSAIAGIMPVVFSLGLGTGFQHFLSFHLGRSEIPVLKRLVRSAFFFALLLSLAAAGATFALSAGLSDLFFHNRSYIGAISVLAIFVGVQRANTTLQSVLAGLQKFSTSAMVAIVGSAAVYGSAVGLFWLHPAVNSIVVGWALGGTLALILYVVVILRTSRGWTTSSREEAVPTGPSLHRSLIAYSLPLFAWSVLSIGALYVDRLVLASVANLASVGVYNYALLIATGSLMIVAPFTTILIPKNSTSFGRQDRAEICGRTQSSITLITLVYAPVGLGVAALGPFLLRYLAGPGFVIASLPMAVLLVISTVFVSYSVLGSVAAGTRRTVAFVKASALALGANVALSIVLVPRFGMLGAALGNSSMVWAPFLVFFIELRKTGLLRFDLKSLSRIWLASGMMSVAIGIPLWFLGYSLEFIPIFVVTGVAFLVVSLRLLGAVTAETAATLLLVLPRWLRGARYAIYWLAPALRIGEASPVTGAGLSYQR